MRIESRLVHLEMRGERERGGGAALRLWFEFLLRLSAVMGRMTWHGMHTVQGVAFSNGVLRFLNTTTKRGGGVLQRRLVTRYADVET